MTGIRKILISVLAAALIPALLAGCAVTPAPEPEPTEEPAAEEESVRTWIQTYVSSAAVVAAEKEGVLFQGACEGGFLAYINRKVREDIPAEFKDDPGFVNRGQYDIYESALFVVSKSGKRNKVRRYRPLAAPEKPEGLEHYYSESRPRAFRAREDGCIIALESSYESWRTDQGTQTRDRYYVRLLKENGVEISCAEIDCTAGTELVCGGAVSLGGDLLAAVQGNAVLFFGLDGQERFTVSTPFAVRELCGTRDGRLAVILEEGSLRWVSVIDPAARSAIVPQELPQNAHDFCAGQTGDRLCFLRGSEVYVWDLQTGTGERLASLFSLGVAPTSVGAFFAGADGSLHFLLHNWNGSGKSVEESYLIASPCEIPTERRLLTLGFHSMSDSLADAVLAFNRENREIFLEVTDWRNREADPMSEPLPDILVMDGDLYDSLQTAGSLADLGPLLEADREYGRDDFFPTVLRALSDGSGTLRRLASVFRIETMACDGLTAEGRTSLSLDDLRSLLSEMPAGAALYEPYYTSGRLLEDLCLVNRAELGAREQRDAALYAKLLNFSNLQPAAYSYNNYAADSAGMESRIDAGRLIFLQAHVATLDDLKWYDAFFANGVNFVGWPTETGSRSRICLDETVGISSACDEETKAAAWQFVRTLLDENNADARFGFPVVRAVLERRMAADAAAVSYRLNEKGKFELDKNGNKIEIARDSWYSPLGRRHFLYALTGSQQQKLLTLIENSV